MSYDLENTRDQIRGQIAARMLFR